MVERYRIFAFTTFYRADSMRRPRRPRRPHDRPQRPRRAGGSAEVQVFVTQCSKMAAYNSTIWSRDTTLGISATIAD